MEEESTTTTREEESPGADNANALRMIGIPPPEVGSTVTMSRRRSSSVEVVAPVPVPRVNELNLDRFGLAVLSKEHGMK